MENCALIALRPRSTRWRFTRSTETIPGVSIAQPLQPEAWLAEASTTPGLGEQANYSAISIYARIGTGHESVAELLAVPAGEEPAAPDTRLVLQRGGRLGASASTRRQMG